MKTIYTTTGKYFIGILFGMVLSQPIFAQNLKKKTQAIFMDIASNYKFTPPIATFTGKDSLDISNLLKNKTSIQDIVSSYNTVEPEKLTDTFTKEWTDIESKYKEIQGLKENEYNNLKEVTNKLFIQSYTENFGNSVSDEILKIQKLFEEEGTYDLSVINAKKALIAKLIAEWPYLKAKNVVDYITGKTKNKIFYIVYCGESKSHINDAYVIIPSNTNKKNDNTEMPKHITEISSVEDRSEDTNIYYRDNANKYYFMRSDKATLAKIDELLNSNANKTSIKYFVKLEPSPEWNLFDMIIENQSESATDLDNKCKDLLAGLGYQLTGGPGLNGNEHYISYMHKSNGSYFTIKWCDVPTYPNTISIDFGMGYDGNSNTIQRLIESFPNEDLKITRSSPGTYYYFNVIISPESNGRYSHFKTFRGFTKVTSNYEHPPFFEMFVTVKRY